MFHSPHSVQETLMEFTKEMFEAVGAAILESDEEDESSDEEVFDESSEEEEIVFHCTTCKKAIIRNSQEHDFAKFDENDEDKWYCWECPLPEACDEEPPKCVDCDNIASINEYYPNGDYKEKYWTLCEECFKKEQDEERMTPEEWFESRDYDECESWNKVVEDAEVYYCVDFCESEHYFAHKRLHDELFELWKDFNEQQACEKCGQRVSELEYLPSKEDQEKQQLLGKDYCLECYKEVEVFEFIENIPN